MIIREAPEKIKAALLSLPRELFVGIIVLLVGTASFGLGRLRCWAQIGHRVVLEPGLRNPALLYKRLVDTRATGLAIVSYRP